jgi:hypothetical protein
LRRDRSDGHCEKHHREERLDKSEGGEHIELAFGGCGSV